MSKKTIGKIKINMSNIIYKFCRQNSLSENIEKKKLINHVNDTFCQSTNKVPSQTYEYFIHIKITSTLVVIITVCDAISSTALLFMERLFRRVRLLNFTVYGVSTVVERVKTARTIV